MSIFDVLGIPYRFTSYAAVLLAATLIGYSLPSVAWSAFLGAHGFLVRPSGRRHHRIDWQDTARQRGAGLADEADTVVESGQLLPAPNHSRHGDSRSGTPVGIKLDQTSNRGLQRPRFI